MSSSQEIISLLCGSDDNFAQGLVQLGWYNYAPTLTEYEFLGKARAALEPKFRRAAVIGDSQVWVYKLNISSAKWQDAVAVVESQLRQEPQFAVVFCNLPNNLLIMAPSSPDKARAGSKDLTVDRIFLDTNRPSNYEDELIKKLKAAPKNEFRARLQELVNTEKVTKKFYDEFKKQLEAFKLQIIGIDVQDDRAWYSSVVLNRLMFVYFLQRKGFLDGDTNYLGNRLRMVQQRRGTDKFHSFYRSFLIRLFHDALGKKEGYKQNPDPVFEELLGKVPYLNGGLFEAHLIEEKYRDGAGSYLIDIPDAAFEKVFDFFNKYEWCLDTRPARTDKEINPDVLGYIFEKYINQKQMGAYYTKEDITEYIAKNTIIPYLFDAVKERHPAAFKGEDSVWSILQIEPDRYIYEAVKKGTELPLPPEIEAGIDDVSRRDRWNTPAPDEYALPTEIWREVVARRQRCAELRSKIAGGGIRSVDDLITHNLNIVLFAQDVLDLTDDPELIRQTWNTMAGRLKAKSNDEPIPAMSILDPTCGSGAFLFAALNILEPLYDGCLDGMQKLVDQAESSGNRAKYPDFRRTLDLMNDKDKHPNRDYFILKSIILGNLYGVDIMDEAVEICKLRLFLKLAGQVEPENNKDNYGLEPLPDIDFNIKSGNTLVGYATYAEAERGVLGSMYVRDKWEQIKDDAAELDRLFERFKEQQTVCGGNITDVDKAELTKKSEDLSHLLNLALAQQYVIDAVQHSSSYDAWLKSHQPFHWFIQFHGVMKRGGFDVVLGNPPYLETREVSYSPRALLTTDSGAIHAMCIERSLNVLSQYGTVSMIVPLALVSTQRMAAVRRLIEDRGTSWYANFSWRPGKLFDTVNRALTIFVAKRSRLSRVYTTCYQKWNSETRRDLFPNLAYVEADRNPTRFWVPKLGMDIEQGIAKKLFSGKTVIANFCGNSQYRIYYRTTGGLYWKVFTDFAPAFRLNGADGHSTRETYFTVLSSAQVKTVIALLSSDIFWWYYTVTSNCRDLNPYDVQHFPVPSDAVDDTHIHDLGDSYLTDLIANSSMLVRNQKQTGTTATQSFKIQKSKHIISQIDLALSKHYGLTDEELDFIINYDIKYRMGLSGNGGDEEE